MYKSYAVVAYTFLIVIILGISALLTFVFPPAILIGLVIVLLLVVEMRKLMRQSSYRATNGEFRQNGVVVDYRARTITINNKRYTADDLTGQLGISWNRNTSVVEIHIKDIGTPIQRVRFVGIYAKREGEDFIERFKAALGNMGPA